MYRSRMIGTASGHRTVCGRPCAGLMHGNSQATAHLKAYETRLLFIFTVIVLQ